MDSVAFLNTNRSATRVFKITMKIDESYFNYTPACRAKRVDKYLLTRIRLRFLYKPAWGRTCYANLPSITQRQSEVWYKRTSLITVVLLWFCQFLPVPVR